MMHFCLYLPPSVTEEVRSYMLFFLVANLFSDMLGLSYSYLSFERSLRVHLEIDSVCPSVPRSSN